MSSAASGTPKWPGDHAEKHRQAALLGWARKRGFTRDTVKRGRRKPSEGYARWRAEYQKVLNRMSSSDDPNVHHAGLVATGNMRAAHPDYAKRYAVEIGVTKEPPSRGMELARQVQVSAQRTRPAAHPDYSPHAGNVARLTLMHELGMEQDAAKRAKIRRELRKLGVPSDQIPKEPRKPRAERKPKMDEAARILREAGSLRPLRPDVNYQVNPAGPVNPYDLAHHFGSHQLRTALNLYSAARLRQAAEMVEARNPGTHPHGHSKPALIAYIMAHVVGGEGAERSAAVSQPKAARKPAAGTRQNTPGLVPVKHVEGHVMNFSGLLDPYYLHELYGPAQFHRALDGYSATRLREAVQVVQERNPGTHPRGHSKPALIAYITAHVGGGEGAERSAAVSQPKAAVDTSGDHLARLKEREAEDMAAMRALFAEFQAGVGPDAEYYENRHALYTVSPKMHRMIRKLRGLRTQIRKAGGTPVPWPSEYGRES